MRVIEVSMEQRRNERVAETGDSRENPPTYGIVRHDSHMRKSGVHKIAYDPSLSYLLRSDTTFAVGRLCRVKAGLAIVRHIRRLLSVRQSCVYRFRPSVESDSQQSVDRLSFYRKQVALRLVEEHVTAGRTDGRTTEEYDGLLLENNMVAREGARVGSPSRALSSELGQQRGLSMTSRVNERVLSRRIRTQTKSPATCGSCYKLVWRLQLRALSTGAQAFTTCLPRVRTVFDSRRCDFRMWESCRTMPLVCGFSLGSTSALSDIRPVNLFTVEGNFPPDLCPLAPSWFEIRSEIGSKIGTENCCTIRVQSWTGDREEVRFEPPKLAVRNLDLRSAAIVDKIRYKRSGDLQHADCSAMLYLSVWKSSWPWASVWKEEEEEENA
ncbi:hypothetical protein PR048_021883 [Dryococelus australis]|uniref:Uncharacterized protein n=1 Tax=Dryococelus australis TaxID=614101 RepID=A0ABQ9GZF5_9NEOP|nr:hypothetical protein PR048_021883 [Dryococelus australis]